MEGRVLVTGKRRERIFTWDLEMSLCCPRDVPAVDTSFLVFMLPLTEGGHSPGMLAMGYLLTPAKPCQDLNFFAHVRQECRILSQNVQQCPPLS